MHRVAVPDAWGCRPGPAVPEKGVQLRRPLLVSAMLADVGADFGAILTDRNGEDNRVHSLIEFPPAVHSQSW